MKETRLINRFSEKNHIWGKWAILDPKIAHLRNSGSAGRIFLKFCIMKGANMYMGILLVVFRKKIHLGQLDLFSLQAIFYCLIGHGQN